MKHLLASTLLATTLSLAPSLLAATTDEPGYVDFGKLSAAPHSQFVEVNLQSGLLKFAAKIAAAHEPDAAELLKNIRHVRVNVVGLDESNKATILERMESIRADLAGKGWEKIVTVREAKGDGGDDVAIFMKSDDDTIQGIVVTVLEKKGNAVFVNVVGNIRAEELARLGEKLDLKPLRDLKLHRNTPRESKQS